MAAVSIEDREAARRLIGCEYPDPCYWEGVVTIQFRNNEGPKWRSCREHAAKFRDDDDYRVIDSGRNNHLLWPGRNNHLLWPRLHDNSQPDKLVFGLLTSVV